MEIKCPLHHSVLQLKKEKLHLLGKQTELITGRCEKCRQVYVDRKLFSSTNAFTANSVEYEFLEELDGIELPEIKPIKEHIADGNNGSAREEKPRYSEGNSHSAQMETKLAEQRKADLQREKEKARADAINQTRNRIVNNLYKEYHVKTVHYQNKATVCHVDGEELLRVERVKFAIDGVTFKTAGMCCLKCNSVYLSEKKRLKIELELNNKREQRKEGAYAPPKQPTYEPTSVEEHRETEAWLGNIPGEAPKRLIKEATIPSELTTAKLQSDKADEIEITIVKDENYQNSAENIWTDEYLYYSFTLTPESINAIRSYNDDVSSYQNNTLRYCSIVDGRFANCESEFLTTNKMNDFGINNPIINARKGAGN